MIKVLVFALLCASISALAEEVDPLKQTQDLLRDRTQREKAISESQNAKRADARVKEQSPDQATQDKYYELLADIMGSMKSEEEMKKSLSEGERDPASFYEKLTPSQKEKVKQLGDKLNPGVKTNP